MRLGSAITLDKCNINWDNPMEETCLIPSAGSLSRQYNIGGTGEPAGVIAEVASLVPKHIVVSHESFGSY